MAEPSADTAGGLAEPPPPPPAPARQTETTGTDMTKRRDADAPTEAQTAGRPQPRQPPLQTQASGSGTQSPRDSSQERAALAEVENQRPAPPPSQEQQQYADRAKDGEDSAMSKPRPSRWPRVRPPVPWLLSLFRLQRQHQLIKQPKIPPPEEEGGTGDVSDKPATDKDEGEGRKRRRHEAEASMSASGRKELPPMKPQQTKRRKSLQRTEIIPPPQPQGGVAGEVLDAGCPRMKKKLENAGSLVMNTMSCYRRHRSPEEAEKPVDEAAAQKEKVEEAKPSTSPAPQEEGEETKSKQDKAEEITKQPPTPEKKEEEETKSKQDKAEETTKQPPTPEQEDKPQERKPHPRWGKEEPRLDSLENILEEACTRLVAAEFRSLGDDEKQCLLTFSVFPLGCKVKKQAVTYWWATQFGLSSEKGGGADGIFSWLSRGGFLEPIKNRCSRVIHGCQVNPLVHWMVKHLAREKDFADLEGCGNPADEQPKSAVLCLTRTNRDRLQNLRKPGGTKKTSKEPPEVGGTSQDVKSKGNSLDDDMAETLLSEFEKKRVILNISAHVYLLPELLLSKLADRLVVLQLGRWKNSDDETYMEVKALEYIGKLKYLRYLSLRGLSQLTELPSEFRRLRRLTILDVRGCQNLVKVSSSAVANLKELTHLDLTECYMLEHIGRGVTALSELQVFKGFVFGVGAQRRKACRLSDLTKLRKLRKLSVNVTTDATVGKDEMAHLAKLTGLRSLTVTWGELPSILRGAEDEDKRLKGLVDRWTGLVLPPELEKLDVRCYPCCTLPKRWFEDHKKLKKLYVRGGEVEELIIPKNKIETLRLRFLNKFRMKWDELFTMLNWDSIKSVEVVDNDQKVTSYQTKGKGEKVKDEQKKMVKDEEERIPIKKRMGVPVSTLDENGVWVRDEMEIYGGGQAPSMAPKEDASKTEAPTGTADVPKVSHKGRVGDGDASKEQTEVKEGREGSLRGAQAEDEPPNEEDGGDTGEVKKVDGGDEKGREIVKEEQDNKKVKEEQERNPTKKRMSVHESNLDENRVRVRDEKKLEDDKTTTSSAAVVDQSAAPASSGDVKKRAGADEDGTDKSSEPLKASQAPRMAPKEDAPKTEAATCAADIPKVSDKGGEGDDDGRNGGAEAEDEPATEEKRGDASEVEKVDDGDGDKAQKEGEVEDEDEGQGRGREVLDAVDEQPTTREDGGDDDTSAADASSSPAAQRRELKEETLAKLIPAAKASASRTTTTPAAPATTGPAPAIGDEAAAEPKEPGKAGDDDGLTSTGATDTRSSTSA